MSVELISVHIPKTAGSSLKLLLTKLYGEENIYFHYQSLGNLLGAKEIPPNIKVIHGHFSLGKYQNHFPDAKKIVWFRHPIMIIISLFNYYRFKNLTPSEEKAVTINRVNKGQISFEEFIAMEANRNLLTKHTGGWKSLEKFDFIGFQEFFEEDVKKMSQLLGFELTEIPYVNKSPNIAYNQYVQEIITNKELIKKLIKYNYNDVQLYYKALELRQDRTNILNQWYLSWQASANLSAQAKLVEQSRNKMSKEGFLQLTSELSNEEFVEATYLVYLKRKADSSGKAEYTKRLSNNLLTRQKLVEIISSTNEKKNRKAKLSQIEQEKEWQNLKKDIEKINDVYEVHLILEDRNIWSQALLDFEIQNLIKPKTLIISDFLYLKGIALIKEDKVKELQYTFEEKVIKKISIDLKSPEVYKKFPQHPLSSSAGWQMLLELKQLVKKDLEISITVLLKDKTSTTIAKIKVEKLDSNQVSDKNEYGKKLDVIMTSRDIAKKHTATGGKYVFIGGCPRSGTTALFRLLVSSEQVGIGFERYLELIGRPDNMTGFMCQVNASLFEKSEFFKKLDKKWYIKQKWIQEYYSSLRTRYNKAKILGDKIPLLESDWKKIRLCIPEANFLYIFRNIYDVAFSYNQRARNELDRTWTKTKDYKEAVRDWNSSILSIKQMAEFCDLYIIKYEDIFFDKSCIDKLLQFLSIRIDIKVEQRMSQLLSTSKKLSAKPRELSSEEKEYIEKYARFDTYEELCDIYKNQPGY